MFADPIDHSLDKKKALEVSADPVDHALLLVCTESVGVISIACQ